MQAPFVTPSALPTTSMHAPRKSPCGQHHTCRLDSHPSRCHTHAHSLSDIVDLPGHSTSAHPHYHHHHHPVHAVHMVHPHLPPSTPPTPRHHQVTLAQVQMFKASSPLGSCKCAYHHLVLQPLAQVEQCVPLATITASKLCGAHCACTLCHRQHLQIQLTFTWCARAPTRHIATSKSCLRGLK